MNICIDEENWIVVIFSDFNSSQVVTFEGSSDGEKLSHIRKLLMHFIEKSQNFFETVVAIETKSCFGSLGGFFIVEPAERRL